MQALGFLHSSYLMVLFRSVQYGRLFHPGHPTINVRRAPYWPSITQTEHEGRVNIQINLMVYGAMATTF